jgi:DNA-binding NtrC family response regulator
MGRLDEAVAATIRRELESALEECGGNRTRAARLLGISRAQIHRHLDANPDLARRVLPKKTVNSSGSTST